MNKAIINVTLFDFNNYLENAYVLFDQSIIAVGPMSEFTPNNVEIIDGHGHWVMPGMVCGHTHVYSTFARGMSTPFNPKDFQEILDQLWWKLDRNLNLDAVYQSGLVSGFDFLKNGVTTVIDHHASGSVKGSLKQLKTAMSDLIGLRLGVAFETSDRFDVQETIDENLAYLNHTSNVFRGWFGLHASMSLSDQTLMSVAKVLNGAPIHIHVAESQQDQDDCLKRYGKRVIQRLAAFKLLTKNSIITHANYVNDDELALIKKHEAVIAVNVSSNMNNGVGIPDIVRFMDKGIRVIIGNDGLSTTMTTEYLTLLYAMHHRYQSPTMFTLDHVKTIIMDTFAYASEMFGLKLGQIEKGCAADLIVIPYTPPTPCNSTNALGHWFFGLLHQLKINHVFIAGQHKVCDGAIIADLSSIYDHTTEAAKQVWMAMKKEEDHNES